MAKFNKLDHIQINDYFFFKKACNRAEEQVSLMCCPGRTQKSKAELLCTENYSIHTIAGPLIRKTILGPVLTYCSY